MSNTVYQMREGKYVDGILRGLTKREAAIAAGFPRSTANHSAGRIHNRPSVQAAIQKVQAELRAEAVYDTKAAVKEVDENIQFARNKGNAMAAAKLLDLKCRLLGLLTDKFDIRISEKPNIATALSDAKRRVTIINPPQLSGPDCIDIFED
jgi:hypothetical protein